MNNTFLNKQNLFSKPISMKMVKINNLLRSLTMVSLMALTFSSSICCSHARDLTLSNNNENSMSGHTRVMAFLQEVGNLTDTITAFAQYIRDQRLEAYQLLWTPVILFYFTSNIAMSMLDDFYNSDMVLHAEYALNHNGHSIDENFKNYANDRLDQMIDLYSRLDDLNIDTITDDCSNKILRILDIMANVNLFLKQMTPPRH